jgi:hypothetical protein
MWQQEPDYARYKEKLNGEGWLVNRQEGMLLQIKPVAPTQHAQFVLVNTFCLKQLRGRRMRQQRFKQLESQQKPKTYKSLSNKTPLKRAGHWVVRRQNINGNHSRDHRRMAHSRRLCHRASQLLQLRFRTDSRCCIGT